MKIWRALSLKNTSNGTSNTNVKHHECDILSGGKTEAAMLNCIQEHEYRIAVDEEGMKRIMEVYTYEYSDDTL